MAAGIVYHNITTASGVTFSLACWVPETSSPDVGAIPVSYPIKTDGTAAAFWQTTQPVSGTFWQGTQPVSGTFWQTTQPISGEVSIAAAQLGDVGPQLASASVSVTPATDRQNTTKPILTLTPHADPLAGEVTCATQQWANFFNVNDGAGVLQDLILIDQSDQGVALTIWFFKANQSLGTEGAVPDIDDTEILDCIGWVDVAAEDYKDVGASRVACLRNLGLTLKAASGTRDLYVGVVNGSGTPTYAASSLHLALGNLND